MCYNKLEFTYHVNTQTRHCLVNAQVKLLLSSEINTNNVSENNDFQSRIPPISEHRYQHFLKYMKYSPTQPNVERAHIERALEGSLINH